MDTLPKTEVYKQDVEKNKLTLSAASLTEGFIRQEKSGRTFAGFPLLKGGF